MSVRVTDPADPPRVRLSRSVSCVLRFDDAGRVVALEDVQLAEAEAGAWGGEMARHAARAVGAMLRGDVLSRGPNDTQALAVQSWAYAVLATANAVVRAERERVEDLARAGRLLDGREHNDTP